MGFRLAGSNRTGPGRMWNWIKHAPRRFWNWCWHKAGPWLVKGFLPAFIFLVGLGVIGFAFALWITGGTASETTVVVNSTVVGPPSSTAVTASAPTTSGRTDTTGKTTEPEDTTPATTTTDSAAGAQVSTTSVNAKTVTSASAATRPSDTLFGALLALGLVLIVTGAYFQRVTSIKFPGGVEVQIAAKAAAAVAKVTSQEEQENPALIKALTVNVATQLSERSALTGLPPTDRAAEQEAARARQLLVGP
jgi:hypothetical protein